MYEVAYFYLLIIPAIVWCLINIMKMRRVRKHDIVLYRMCAVRRSIMSLLRERGFAMKKEDYLVVKDLLEFVSMTIHEYDACKSQVFNFRRFIQNIKAYRAKTEEVKQIKIPHDKAIQDLFKMSRIAMFRGFLAYTPFMRFEISIRLLVAVTAFLAKLGIEKAKQWTEAMAWFQHEYQEIPIHKYCGGHYIRT